MRVLLIDDDETTSRLLLAMLARLARGPGSFEAVRVGGLFEGLRRLGDAAEEFDAVLLDLGLPECGGLTTLRLVRAQAPGVPVVVVSAGDGPGVERAVRDAGAEGYLARGRIDAPSLERALLDAVARARPSPSRPELCGTFRLVGHG